MNLVHLIFHVIWTHIRRDYWQGLTAGFINRPFWKRVNLEQCLDYWQMGLYHNEIEYFGGCLQQTQYLVLILSESHPPILWHDLDLTEHLYHVQLDFVAVIVLLGSLFLPIPLDCGFVGCWHRTYIQNQTRTADVSFSLFVIQILHLQS